MGAGRRQTVVQRRGDADIETTGRIVVRAQRLADVPGVVVGALDIVQGTDRYRWCC